MDDAEERIERLERTAAKLADMVVELRTEANFTNVIARQAMFSLSRVIAQLDKTGIIGSAEQNGLLAVTHALLLRHEQNELFSAEDRASVRLWREQLARDA